MSEVYIFPGSVTSFETTIENRYGRNWIVKRLDILPGDEVKIFWDSLPEDVRKEMLDNIRDIFNRRIEQHEYNPPKSLHKQDDPRRTGHLQPGPES